MEDWQRGLLYNFAKVATERSDGSNPSSSARYGLIVVVAAHYFCKVEGRVRFSLGPLGLYQGIA